MLLPTDINPYSFSLAVSTVTSPSLTTSTLSLKTISRRSWRSNARCLTTTTPGSTSAFISSPRQDTPSSPWTLSLWKNWTARYTQLTHKHTYIYIYAVVFPFGAKHTLPVLSHCLWITISVAEIRPPFHCNWCAFHFGMEIPDLFAGAWTLCVLKE